MTAEHGKDDPARPAESLPIATLSLDGGVLRVNAAMRALLGRGPEGDDANDADIGQQVAGVVRDAVAAGLYAGSVHVDVRLPGCGRRSVPLLWNLLPVQRGPARSVLLLSAAAGLRAAAFHDALTGLANRGLFLDRVEQLLADDGTESGVLVVNLDGFRSLNASLGRSAGDELLVEVAERICQAAGTTDAVARLDADEFAVFADATRPQQLEVLGHAILAAIAEPLTIDGIALELTAAVGIARTRVGPADGLLRCANTAMRVAKAAGVGAILVYDQDLAEAAERESALGPELSAALAADQLVMHFQPIVDLTTGHVLGMEALARWTHAQLGEVEPVRIVALAGRYGLSSDLDRWALRTGLRGARELQRTGTTSRDAYVSVNLTAGHLTTRGLEEFIVSETLAAGLMPGHVQLEITETAIMDEPDLVVGMLRRLRTRGFRVAIDDFGTGYSSLAYLRDLPVSSLKIDRSFVAEIRSDSDALAIVAAIIDVARAVGVTAVAKGVETRDQADLLKEIRCPAAQGWLWSAALSLGDIVGKRGWGASGDVGAGAPPTAPLGRNRTPVGLEHGLDRMLSMHSRGASLSTIAASLNADGYVTPRGLRWHGTSVARAVADAAYPRLTEPKTR